MAAGAGLSGALLILTAAGRAAPEPLVPEGTLLQAGNGALYLVEDGLRRPVTPLAVPDAVLTAMPEGRPVAGGLLACPETPLPAASPAGLSVRGLLSTLSPDTISLQASDGSQWRFRLDPPVRALLPHLREHLVCKQPVTVVFVPDPAGPVAVNVTD